MRVGDFRARREVTNQPTEVGIGRHIAGGISVDRRAIAAQAADQAAHVIAPRHAAAGIAMNIATRCHRRGGAVADLAVHESNQTAHIVLVCTDWPGGIGTEHIGSRAIGQADQAAHIALARHTAAHRARILDRVIAFELADEAAHEAFLAHQVGAHTAGGAGIGHIARIVADQAAQIAGANDVARGGGIDHVARVTVANQAADVIAVCGSPTDIAYYRGSGDGAIARLANQAAYALTSALHVAGDAGCRNVAVALANEAPHPVIGASGVGHHRCIGDLGHIGIADQAACPLPARDRRARRREVAEIAEVPAVQVADQTAGVVAGAGHRSSGAPIARQGAAARGVAKQAPRVLVAPRDVASSTQVVSSVGVNRSV